MIGFRWVTLAAIALVAFVGCSGSSERKGPGSGSGAVSGSGGKGEGGNGGSGASPSAGGRGGAASAGTDGGGAASGAGDAGADDGGADGGGGARAGGGGRGGSSAGTGGTAVSGAGGGASGAAPAGWTCLSATYGDGKSCDCGCGALDPDCEDESVGSCDACHLLGSCASGPCPSSIVAGDNTRCSIPVDWTCHPADYGNGRCDCGCGVVDVDCADETGQSCEHCPLQGCANGDCAAVNAENNALCTVAPPSWTCSPRLYFDGSRCDCGCGVRDPDCSRHELDACDSCNSAGSCSRQPCPGTIDPDSVARCEQPLAPSGWTCWHLDYADGKSCDCGCGVQDLDCLTSDPAECDSCACSPARCPASVNPEDPTECAPPPPEWTCAEQLHADGLCHCGCGAVDVDCYDATINSCELCQGCTDAYCEGLDPLSNGTCLDRAPEGWTCAATLYGDDACDCGCGVIDSDCASANEAACDFCDADGSCSDVPCANASSTIDPSDNSRCTE